MNLHIEKIRKVFSGHNLRKLLFKFMSGQASFFMLLVIISLFFYCVYIWYDSIYAPEWSESEKQEYIKNKEKGVVFNKSSFEAIVSESQKRLEESQKKIDAPLDIFRLEK